jgi:hypothetical protein
VARRRSKKPPKYCTKCCDQSWRVKGKRCEKCGLEYAEERITPVSIMQSNGHMEGAVMHLGRSRPVRAE